MKQIKPGFLLIQANIDLCGDRSLPTDDWAFAVSFIQRVGMWLTFDDETKDHPKMIVAADISRKAVYGYLWPVYEKFVGERC